MDIKSLATEMDGIVAQGAIVDAVKQFFAEDSTTSDYNGVATTNKQEMVEKMNRLEEVRLSESFDYEQLVSLSSEAREKLSKLQPRTIGQASRISGVSPADISVLLVHMGR